MYIALNVEYSLLITDYISLHVWGMHTQRIRVPMTAFLGTSSVGSDTDTGTM